MKTIPIQSRKYTISSLTTKYQREGQGTGVVENIYADPFDFFLCLAPTLIILEYCISTVHSFMSQHELAISSILLKFRFCCD